MLQQFPPLLQLMVMAIVAPIGIREAVLRPGAVGSVLNLAMAAMFLRLTEARASL